MSTLQIIMFAVGGGLVVLGLIGLLPVLFHRSPAPVSREHLRIREQDFLPVPSPSAELRPAAAPNAGQPATQTAPVPQEAGLNEGMVEELFAELFSVRMAIDELAAEVHAIHGKLATSPQADASAVRAA